MRKGSFRAYLHLFALLMLSKISFGSNIHHPPPDEETPNSFDIKPIVVEDVLTDAEIDEIAATKNYFYRDHLEREGSPWNKLDRKYSKQFFKNRTETYDQKAVLRTVLQQGMPMRYQINQLYRGQLEPHIAFGNVIPNLCLTVGDGMSPISINNAFNGLLNILLPQNWLNLVIAGKQYKIAKYLFMQLALDQYYETELQYIAVHKLIFDLEIYNYYLVHLELFTRIFPPDDPGALMVRGKMASVATDMANIRIALRLALDQLAYMMAMTKDQHHLYGASKMNIANLPDFDETIKNLEEINPLYAHKHEFIQEVIDRSIELRSVEELYKISKLNIGVTAFGSLLGVPSRGTPAQIVFTLNYSLIPQILFSKSLSNTAQIDVENQLLKMVNTGRVAWDTYKYNIGLYVEAQRSLIINRKALKASLDRILDNNARIDGVLLNGVIQLIDGRVKLNAAVHGAQGALALMRRLMVTEEKNIHNYIPVDKNINAALKLFMDTYGKEADDNQYLDNLMRIIHRKSKLEQLFTGKWKGEDGKIREFSPNSIKDAVLRNASFLLYKKWNFPKSKRFFKVLKNYVEKNNIPLASYDKETLDLLAKHYFVRK